MTLVMHTYHEGIGQRMLPTRSPDRSFSLPDSKQNDDVGFEVTTGLSLHAFDRSKPLRWTRLVIMIRTLTDLGTC
jgi:hypothetical protein